MEPTMEKLIKLKAKSHELMKEAIEVREKDPERSKELADQSDKMFADYQEQKSMHKRLQQYAERTEDIQNIQEVRKTHSKDPNEDLTDEQIRKRNRLLVRYREGNIHSGKHDLSEEEFSLAFSETKRDKAFWRYMMAKHPDPADVSLLSDESLFFREAQGGFSKYPGFAEEIRAPFLNTPTTGGYFVPEGFYNQLISEMKYYGPMADPSMTRFIRTPTGNQMPVPVQTATPVATEPANENTAIADVEPVAGQTLMGAFRQTTGLPVSNTLIQDSAFPIDGFLREFNAEAIGRRLNQIFTRGIGSTSALVANAADARFITSGVNGINTVINAPANRRDTYSTAVNARRRQLAASGSIGVADIMGMITLVDPAYRPGAVIQASDTILYALRAIARGKPATGTTNTYDLQSLWVPSLQEGIPDRMMGYEVYTNNDLESTLNANFYNVMNFGQMNRYLVRHAGPMRMDRFDSTLAQKDQTYFRTVLRVDGAPLTPLAFSVMQAKA